MPRGIYNRRKKKNKVVLPPIASSYVNKIATPNYEKMYYELKNDLQKQRYQIINDWMKSVATINDAIGHSIGEIGNIR